jgi:hydrogenase maturation protease HycI
MMETKQMSSSSWQDQLHQTMVVLQTSKQTPRVAVVGIGHELCGDDAAGVAVARGLQRRCGEQDRILVIDAGPSPEKSRGLLRRFRPDLVLLVDAAHVDPAPGTVCWLDWRDTLGFGASTHTSPLHLYATYLTAELGCEVAMLGIQPAVLTVDSPLSPVVNRAVATVVRALVKELSL